MTASDPGPVGNSSNARRERILTIIVPALILASGLVNFILYHDINLLRPEALLACGERRLKSPEGKVHDWPVDLGRKLTGLQGENGAWVNSASRWWEANPVLVTAYAVIALDSCRQGLDLK